MRLMNLLGVVSVLALSVPVQAADNGIYIGAGFGQSNVEIDGDAIDGFDFDGDDTAWKLIAGIRPLDWLAVEANYVDFGEAEDRGVDLEADGVSAFAVGFLPLGPVDVFAKLGLINYETSAALDGLGRFAKDDGTELAYGAGVQFRVWSLSVRGEYEVFDVEDVDDLTLMSVGVTFTFL